MKKDFVPRIIHDGCDDYLGFIENDNNTFFEIPKNYHFFINKYSSSVQIKNTEPYLSTDKICKLTMADYFKYSTLLKMANKKYNLKKIQHELNRDT